MTDRRKGGGQAIEGLEAHVRGHHRGQARAGGRDEGHQLHLPEPVRVVRQPGEGDVRVLRGVAMPGKVLHAARYAGALQRLRQGDAKAGHAARIPSEGAVADHRVLGVGVDVDDRGEVQVDAAG